MTPYLPSSKLSEGPCELLARSAVLTNITYLGGRLKPERTLREPASQQLVARYQPIPITYAAVLSTYSGALRSEKLA